MGPRYDNFIIQKEEKLAEVKNVFGFYTSYGG